MIKFGIIRNAIIMIFVDGLKFFYGINGKVDINKLI